MDNFEKHKFLLRNKSSGKESFTLRELQAKRRRGEITDTTQIWSTKLRAWLPYNEILSEEMLVGADLSYSKSYSEYRNRTKKYKQFQNRPWARFWARMIDYNCLGIVYGIIFKRYYMYSPLIFFPFFTIIFIPFLWIPIESILLWTIGTTPGKWLLKITLFSRGCRYHSNCLTFQQALRRSLSVWVFGMGCGIPIIQIITLIIAKVKLSHTGITTWDKNCHLIVRHRSIGILRIFSLILFFIILFYILFSMTTSSFVMWEKYSEYN